MHTGTLATECTGKELGNLLHVHTVNMLSPSKVIRNPDPQVFAPMNYFNLIVVHINWEIEIVAA